MTPQGWQNKYLGEFIEFKNGINADKNAYGTGVKFVNVMDIFEYDFLCKSKIRGAIQVTDNQKKQYSVITGDILFNRTSETFDEIAMAAVYEDTEPVVFGGFVIRGRQKNQLLKSHYSGYCMRSASVRREMIRRGQGGIRTNIGQKDLEKVPVLIPP